LGACKSIKAPFDKKKESERSSSSRSAKEKASRFYHPPNPHATRLFSYSYIFQLIPTQYFNSHKNIFCFLDQLLPGIFTVDQLLCFVTGRFGAHLDDLPSFSLLALILVLFVYAGSRRACCLWLLVFLRLTVGFAPW
jgi:hypothetical protein